MGTNQLSCLKRTRVPPFPGFVRPPPTVNTRTREMGRKRREAERTNTRAQKRKEGRGGLMFAAHPACTQNYEQGREKPTPRRSLLSSLSCPPPHTAAKKSLHSTTESRQLTLSYLFYFFAVWPFLRSFFVLSVVSVRVYMCVLCGEGGVPPIPPSPSSNTDTNERKEAFLVFGLFLPSLSRTEEFPSFLPHSLTHSTTLRGRGAFFPPPPSSPPP